MVTVKLVFQPTGEIRRIPSGSCPSFSALQSQLLPSLFGPPPEKEFTLQYEDDEGDLCIVGSDSELEEAVAVAVSMGAKSLRLRVFLTKASAIESQNPTSSSGTAADQTAAATNVAGKCVSIRLESHKFAFKEIALDGTIDEVTIAQVHSQTQPTPTNWGWNGNILWVDQGLCATFKVVLHTAPARDYDTMPAIHYGIVCDRSGQCPIIGPRYKLRGEDFDLCQAEFDKCSDAEKAQYIRIEAPDVAAFSANGFPWHFRGLCGGRRGGARRGGRGGGKNKACKVVNEIQDAAKNLGEILEHASLDELLMQAQIAESLGSGSGSPVSDSPVVRLISSFTGVPELATAAATIISALNQDTKATAPVPPLPSTPASSEALEEKTIEPNEPPAESKTSASGLSAPHPVPPLAQLVGAMAGPAIGAMASQVVQQQQQAAQAQASAGVAVHAGISCDRSGQCPIVGPRYSLEGADYDLCQEEFDKCSEAEKLMYLRIDRPGMKGIKIMDQGAADEDGNGSTDPELLQALAASLETGPTAGVTEGAAAEETAKDPVPTAAAEDLEDFEVVSKPEAPAVPVKFEEELNSLAKMGFFDREANVALLERYNGRLDRVINYLLDI